MNEEIKYTDSDFEEKEIELMPIFKKVWDEKIYILKRYVSVAVVVGLIVAFSIHNEYTSVVIMAPEGVKTTNPMAGMADLAKLAGIDLAKKEVDGINLTLYPNIIESVPFRVALAETMVLGDDMPESVTLYDYIENDLKEPWWNVVISLPLKALSWVVSLFKEEISAPQELNYYNLSLDQMEILDGIKERVSISIDQKTGTVNASATMQNPKISAQVVDTIVVRLNKYMTGYFTKKSQQNLDFIQSEYEKAQPRYYEASKRLAKHVDENRSIVLQSVAIERKRLEEETTLAYSLYAGLASQLDQAKMAVFKETPVITIIDPARIPDKKSNMGKGKMLAIFVILGGFIGAAVVIFKNKEELL